MPGVTIHGLSKETLAALTMRAKHNHMSQQEYLRRLIVLNLTQPEITDLLERMEETMKICTMAIRENTEVVGGLVKEEREGLLR
ncbi:MAG: hypothetical protein ABF586_11375 [Sporolactobacillus sp.]